MCVVTFGSSRAHAGVVLGDDPMGLERGQVKLAVSKAEAEAWLCAHMDELSGWKAGGLPFARKPFIGEVGRRGFRVRALSARRNEATCFLVGELEPEPQGARMMYRIEEPRFFMRSLPWVAGGASVMFGYVGYRFSAVLPGAQWFGQAAAVVWCTIAIGIGLVLGIALMAYVFHGIRADRAELVRFVNTIREELGKGEGPDDGQEVDDAAVGGGIGPR